MIKFMQKLFLFFMILIIGFNTAISLAEEQRKSITTSETQKTETEDVEKEITRLMKRFFSEVLTEEEQVKIELEIEQKFGLQALPYLIKGIAEDQKEIVRHRSFSLLNRIIYRKVIVERNARETDIFTLPLSKEDKEILEKCFQSALKYSDDKDNLVRWSAIICLGLFRNQRAIPILQKALNDPCEGIRSEAYFSLVRLGCKDYNYFKVMTGKEPKTPEEYIEFIEDTKWGLWIKAKEEVKKFGKVSIPILLKLASSDKEPARQRAISLLGEMKAEEAIPVFVDYLKKETKEKEEVYTQICCIGALFKMDTEKSIKIIEEYGLKHKNPEIRYYTAERMYRIINPGFEGEKGRYPLIEKEKERLKEEAKKVLIDLVKEVDVYKKLDIGILLINNKEKEGIDILIDLLKERGCFKSAKMWLESVTKQDFGDIPPVVSKKMLEQYINKWKDWWEKNKDTFEFK